MELLALYDDKFEIMDNDDISLVSMKSEEEMICIHLNINVIKEEGEVIRQKDPDGFATEGDNSGRDLNDSNRQNIMVDNEGWFADNKKKLSHTPKETKASP